MFRLFLTVIVALSPLAARQSWHASTVIAVHNYDSLVIGADSRTSVTMSSGLSAPVDTACKIIPIGRYIFAYTGFPKLCTDNGPGGCWDALEHAREAVRLALPFSQTVQYFADRASESFLEKLQQLGTGHDPLVPLLVTFHAGVNALFGGTEHDSLGLYFVTFTIRSYDSVRNTFTLDRRLRRIFSEQTILPHYHLLGHIDSLQAFEKSTNMSVYFYRNGYSAGIADLIERQSRKTPESVGGDIDIVRMSRGGSIHWIRRKRICPGE
jgi:hypothetical protein